MKIDNRQQILAAVAIAVVVLFVADKAVLTPLTNLWKARSKSIAELRLRVAGGGDLLRNEGRVRDRWEEVRTNALPDNASAAEQRLFAAFDLWSQNSRVSLNSQIPQWKQDADDYRTLELRVAASGDLRSISRFIYDLERDPMALRLQSIELTSSDPNGQVMSLGLHVSALVMIPESQRQQR